MSSGGPKFCAAAGSTHVIESPSVAASAARREDVVAFMVACSSLGSSHAPAHGFLGAPAREPIAEPDQHCKQRRLHQAERCGLARIATLVIIEQQYGHDHGVAGVEKQR